MGSNFAHCRQHVHVGIHVDMSVKKKVRFVHVATADDHLVATDSEGRMWERFKSQAGRVPEVWHEVERPDEPVAVQDRGKKRAAKR